MRAQHLLFVPCINIASAHLANDGEKNSALINLGCEAAENMYNILVEIEEKLKIDQPVLELGKALPVRRVLQC